MNRRNIQFYFKRILLYRVPMYEIKCIRIVRLRFVKYVNGRGKEYP